MPEERILIAEDDVVFATGLADLLKGLGYRVVGHAMTGPDAVRSVEETRPDLVLMDIELKGQMTGIEAADQIHANNRIPAVYLTVHTEQEMLE